MGFEAILLQNVAWIGAGTTSCMPSKPGLGGQGLERRAETDPLELAKQALVIKHPNRFHGTGIATLPGCPWKFQYGHILDKSEKSQALASLVYAFLISLTHMGFACYHNLPKT